MPKKCPAFYAFREDGNLYAVKCGQWSCPNCAKLLARIWAYRVRLHIEQAQTDAYFWTLTLRGKYRTAGSGYDALPKLWDSFRKEIQRTNRKWSYCAFVEGQPKRDFMPHFHIISMAGAPRRIKDMAMDHGFGHQAKQSLVDSGLAAWYCAKYASKTNPETPKGFRRIRASRDWAKLPPYEGEPYIVKAYTETLTHYLMRVHEITMVPIDDLLYIWQNQLYHDKVTNIDTSLC